MRSKLLSIFLLITVFLVCNLNVVMASASDANRYIVLVLETSEGSEFTVDGRVVYDAKSPIEYTKQAAKAFVNQALFDGSYNKIAVVSYNSGAQCISTFTNDKNSLCSSIDYLYAKDKHNVDIGSGLRIADTLLNSVNGEKHVVLLTTGMSFRSGGYSYSGKYDETVVGSIWNIPDTGIHLYAHANEVHRIADIIKETATIHTVGVFQTMSQAPETVRPIAAFFRLFASDLASDTFKHYAVENINDLTAVFKNVANEIQNPSVAYSFDISPKSGKANINQQQWTGDVFTFTAVTSQNVNEISICGDKPDDTLWHEISYDYLKENYGLDYVDNYDGTRTWTCQFGIHETGERAFMLKINGHETDFVTHATLYENNGSFSPTPQQNAVKVMVNGEYVNFDVLPQIINNRTMIPLRAVVEAFGAEVTWYNDSRSIRIRGKYPNSDYLHYWMNLSIGSDTLSYCQFNSDYTESLSDGMYITLDSPPVIVDNRTLVPIRAIAELIRYKVDWDNDTRTVIITE